METTRRREDSPAPSQGGDTGSNPVGGATDPQVRGPPRRASPSFRAGLPIPCYAIDREAGAFLLAGGETAIPAISQLLEALAPDRYIEVAHPHRVPLPDAPHATVEWHHVPPSATPGDALVAAVRGADLFPGTRVWAAGEAAPVQRIRRHLFVDRGRPGAHASVRGYWMHGRSADAEDDA
jgi:NADPH-dependent ferric siderophore reductase